MYRRCLIVSMLLVIGHLSVAQTLGIGTNSPDTSARLEMKSNNKGVLFPRVDIQSIISPAKGLMAFDNSSNELMINKGSSTAANWQSFSGESTNWNLQGNAGTNPSVNFVGGIDNERLAFRIRNVSAGTIDSAKNSTSFGFKADNGYSAGGNTSFGVEAFKSNAEGYNNVSFGTETLQANSIGHSNVGFGYGSLWLNTSGFRNVGIGDIPLAANKLGSDNTIVGYLSAEAADLSIQMTAVGSYALKTGEGIYNTGLGYSAMYYNTNGTYNTVFGVSAMHHNEAGDFNTAVGTNALSAVFGADQNVAIGLHSQNKTQDGQSNYSAGWNSLANNVDGSFNVAVGDAAAINSIVGEKNTAIGSGAYYASTGSETNTMFGYHAGFDKNLGWNNTLLGADANLRYDGLYNSIVVGVATSTGLSNMGMFGNNYTNSIGGPRAWSNLSDGRFKKNVQENVKGLEFIMKLRPVTYHLNVTALQNFQNADLFKNADEKMLQSISAREKETETGFIAQEVEQAAKDAGYEFNGVVRPANDGDHYRMKYESFVVPLVKGMQEQQVQIEAQLSKDREQLNKLNQIKQRLEKLER